MNRMISRRTWSTSFVAVIALIVSASHTSMSQAALVSYWNFDESASGTGTAFDQQGSSNGTFTGGTTRTSGFIGVGAASYNGANPAGVNVGAAHAFTTGIALEAIVSNTTWAGTTYEEIFRKEDGGNRLLFSLQAGNILSFGINGGSGYGEFDVVLDGTGGKPTVGQFTTGNHHVIAQYNASSGLQELFYDGSLIASRTFQAGPNMISGGAANGFIGSSNGTSEGWNGVIDEVALYNSPLTVQEIAMHSFNLQNGQNYFFQPAPEPSTGLLLTFAVGLLSMKRRRRVLIEPK